MNNHNELMQLVSTFLKSMEVYCVERKQIDESFYIARNWIRELHHRSFYDAEIRENMIKYFNGKGKTTLLKSELLTNCGFNHSNNAHFNAFALIDSVSCTI